MKDGVMQFVTERFHRPGCGSYGAEAEAFQALMNCGEIPKKWFSSSASDWCGSGYFDGPVTKHYSIQRIE